MKQLIITCIALFIIFAGCTKNGPTADVCAGISTSFASTVQPIINTSCAIGGCHNATSTNVGGPLTSYNLIFAKRSTIKSQIISGAMPQTGSLSTDQKNKIICWIDAGAPNN